MKVFRVFFLLTTIWFSPSAFSMSTNYAFSVGNSTTGASYFGTNVFGLVNNDPFLVFSGSFTLDDSLSGVSQLTALSFVTGNKTWSLSDLNSGSYWNQIYRDANNNLNAFSFNLGALVNTWASDGLVISSNNTFLTHDANGDFIACNSCVSFKELAQVNEPVIERPGTHPSAVPLPAALTLMLSGLSVLGFASCRRKKVV